MRNKVMNVLFGGCAVVVLTGQARRPDDEKKPVLEDSGKQHASTVQRDSTRPRAEPVQAKQGKHNDQVKSPMRTPPPAVHREAPPQVRSAQPSHQERKSPRIYAVAAPAPVENRQHPQRQHHKYWHPRYNFYEHQYHFYPYVNVASMVELAPECVQVVFDGNMYYYDHWTFYQQTAEGYLAVPPPIGIVVLAISSHATQVIINGDVYYNYNDVFYKPVGQGYQVVEPLK